MPTTIDSAGITFNDATSLTSASIGTAQLVNGSVIASKLGTTEQKQICKAWVNFNGTTSPGTIRSSYNVSSVTKNGSGDYTVNFTTAMTDANYSVSGMHQFDQVNSSSGSAVFLNIARYSAALSTNSVRVFGNIGNSTILYDGTTISVQVFGN
jgi:hypothetical protein